VRLIADKICSIQWRLDPAEPWLPYNTAQTIAIDSTATLYYRAQDSCANELETQQERYVIKPQSAAAPCPGDMEQVSVGGSSFCIDRYEWPNRRGARPLSYISFYQAMDSCYGVGKRLCSADEWKIACSGPSNWDYPYGQRYEKRACTTQDTMLHLSGSKPACRGYFDVYDLSGNLLEWTSSKASENTLFYYVMGGFWQSGPQSGCFDTRYSYFPQNRHNPVGFRCCRDSANHGQ
jgi:formylglycine-generating enzyme required for sulfatase activity